MPVVINGTTGVSGVDGSASTPSYQGTDTNTGIFYPAADTIAFAEGGTEVMRLDSSGNLLVGTTSASTPSSTGFISSANTFGFKNRIINGGMQIDQRNAGASVTPTTANTTYAVDRFLFLVTQASKLTAQRSTVAPSGFTNSLLVTSSSAYSVVAGDYFGFKQPIEGLNVSDLAWGTASAKTVTLSFWVRSSLTGTFGGSLYNSAFNRSYPFSYSISSANTFEYKSITIAGDTTGTWLTDNGIGIQVFFSVGTGSTFSGTAGAWSGSGLLSVTGATSVVGTNGATWYITGVQLEVGTAATSFDVRDYGRELQLCQRYCFRLNATALDQPWAMAAAYSSTSAFGVLPYPVPMRATPTLTFNAVSTLRLLGNGAGYTASESTQGNATPYASELIGTYTGLTAGYSYWFRSSGNGDWILGTAEL